MAHAKSSLNTKQVAVLRWVANGARDRDTPSEGFAARITARALASRGLVRISGKGPTWRVELTAAGKSRVEQIAYEVRAQPKDEDVANLIARIDANGGSLLIEERDNDGRDYSALVASINKSPLRRRGKRVKWTGNWRGTDRVTLSYEDWFWDLVPEPNVEVVGERSHLGAVARMFLEDKNEQYVSSASLRRAARVLESIVRYAEAVGIDARDPRRVDRELAARGQYFGHLTGHLALTEGTGKMRIQIREVAGRGGGKFNLYPDDSGGRYDRAEANRVRQLPVWMQRRNYYFVPTGRLELRLHGASLPYDGKRIGDTQSEALEAKLGQVFQTLEVLRLQSDAALRKLAEREREREVQWHEAMGNARTSFDRDQRRRLVVDRARAWREYVDTSAFLAELKRRSVSDEWIELADEVLTGMDPIDGIGEVELRSPTLEDL